MAVFNRATFTNTAKQTDVAIRACKLQIADGMLCAVEGAGIAISICPYRCPVASAGFCRVGQGDVGGKGAVGGWGFLRSLCPCLQAVGGVDGVGAGFSIYCITLSVRTRVTRSRALPTCAEASTVMVTFPPPRLPSTLQPAALSARVLMSV